MSQLLTSDAPVNQSVERAVRLLGFFSPEEPELTLAQLTQRLGTSRATTHRYTLALRRVGLLRFDAGAAVYSLGPRIVELAATALAGLRIVRIAGPTMERLVTELNDTVVLSIWDGLWGTLYVPRAKEEVRYGLVGETRPFPTVLSMYLRPFADCWSRWKADRSQLSPARP